MISNLKNIILPFLLLFGQIILLSCNDSDIFKNNLSITFWGDSMTAGVGGNGTSISKIVGHVLNRPVHNFGVGGLASDNIACLQGGIPLTIKIENNRIPSQKDEGVKILSYNVLPFNFQTEQFRYGKLNGIAGYIRRYSYASNPEKTLFFNFSRSENGKEVLLPEEGGIFTFNDAENHRGDVTVIWAGRNDPRTDSQIDVVETNILKMVNHLTSKPARYIVISVCNGSPELEGTGSEVLKNIINLNERLKSTFGVHYLDLREYMVQQAIYDAAINPTVQDLKDIEMDCIPTSLRYDGLHFNAKGYEMAGKLIANKITALKY